MFLCIYSTWFIGFSQVLYTWNKSSYIFSLMVLRILLNDFNLAVDNINLWALLFTQFKLNLTYSHTPTCTWIGTYYAMTESSSSLVQTWIFSYNRLLWECSWNFETKLPYSIILQETFFNLSLPPACGKALHSGIVESPSPWDRLDLLVSCNG